MLRTTDSDRRTESATRWLTAERFVYAALGELAVLRLVGQLRPGHKPPKCARLIVWRDRLATLSCPLPGGDGHRGPIPRLSLTRRALLWQATFEVPLHVVEATEARFVLAADHHVALALPAPCLVERRVMLDAGRTSRPSLGARASRYAVALTAGVAAAAAVSAGTIANADTAPSAPAPIGTTAGDGSTGAASAASTAEPATTAPEPNPATTGTTETTPTPPATTPTPPATTPTSTETAPAPTATASTPTSTTPIPTPATSTPAPLTTASAAPPATPTTPTPRRTTRRRHRHRKSPSAPVAPHPRPRHQPGISPKPRGSAPRSSGRGTDSRHGRPATPRPHHLAPAHVHHAARPEKREAQELATAGAQSILALTGNPLTIDPFTAAQIAHFESIGASLDQPPAFLVPIYKRAARRYGLPWQILAAINAIETDYGRNLNVSVAGAIGWMQFEPGTWLQYGVSADGSGRPNPYDPKDAIFSAARFLVANGAPAHMRRAIYAYNHALWYVDAVLWRAQLIVARGVDGLGQASGYALPLDAQYMRTLGRTDDGVDIETAPDGAAVYSMTPGIVTAVASDPSGFGPDYPVVLATAGPLAGQYIYYGHVAASLVSVGQHVLAGQPIAIVGHTGDAAALGHGHIEIGFSDGSGDPLNHHGLAAWTPAGDAMRHALEALASVQGTHGGSSLTNG